jgi:hypothetical protein
MPSLHQAIAPALITKHPWQIAYATSDTAAAIIVFRELYNCPNFYTREPVMQPVSTPNGPTTLHLLLSFAYLGEACIELIEPLKDNTGNYHDNGIYSSMLPAERAAPVIHHLAYLMDGDLDGWTKFRTQVPDELVLFEGAVKNDRRFLYLDTKSQLGHYLEYLWYSPEYREIFDAALPRN